jgi:adenosylhomocysteine nucleosidase
VSLSTSATRFPGVAKPAIVTGFQAEARIARRSGLPVGGLSDAARLLAAGAGGLVSFGIAGGLAPGIAPGTLVIATEVIAEDGQRWAALDCRDGNTALVAAIHAPVAGASRIVATAGDKKALHLRTGAVAVDMESAAVARLCGVAGAGFAVIRAIADSAERDLPPAALIGLGPDGRVNLRAVMASILRQPGQVPALVGVALDTRRALVALGRVFPAGA